MSKDLAKSNYIIKPFIISAIEASLEKEDPISTSEMLLSYAYHIKKIFRVSPISVLNDRDINSNDNENNVILEKAWIIADLYNGETRIMWYLLIAWYFDNKGKVLEARKNIG